ncbi:MAG: type II secretion system F family protein [Chloroflexi bacterium]|nr:type II secretion system F family protein [Chloroflexota bacterium]
MDLLLLAISLFVLGTVMLFVLAFGKRESHTRFVEARLKAFREDEKPSDDKEEVDGLRHKQDYSGIPAFSSLLARVGSSEAIALQLERAGVPLRVGEYYMIRLIAAVALFLAPLVFGFSLFNLFIALVLGVVGYMAPSQWLKNKRNKRTERINAQLVDMLGMVSNSIKSGYGLMQSLEFAGSQLPDPLGLELRRMLREATLGMTSENALHAMGQRINSKDLDLVLIAINIQRAVGGNLAEILDKVAYTMRERERIRSDIATLTSQQKLTGIVVGGLPFFMFAIFTVMNPEYMSVFFEENIGRLILVVAIGLEVLGYLAMKRIMAIEI